jgi:hypothetical protein
MEANINFFRPSFVLPVNDQASGRRSFRRLLPIAVLTKLPYDERILL